MAFRLEDKLNLLPVGREGSEAEELVCGYGLNVCLSVLRPYAYFAMPLHHLLVPNAARWHF